MFGCLAAYLHGRLIAVIADREDPWRGLLVPTSKEYHESIIEDYPALSPHPVLGKWLYISSSHEDFEGESSAILEAIASGDARLGVEPKEKKTRASKKNPSKKKTPKRS